MYSETDLTSAIDAGILTPDAVSRFRSHVALHRATPSADEESFRLLTGFNDIFVSIAAILLLVAVGWIGFQLGGALTGVDLDAVSAPDEVGIAAALGAFGVAGASWLLGEYFTRRRRMALPSILLLIGFAGGMFTGFAALLGAFVPSVAEHLGLTDPEQQKQLGGAAVIIVGALTAAGAWAHWRRFMVPITIAVGALAVVCVAVGAILAALPDARGALNVILLAAGVMVFLFAMRWDMSDRERTTRRSDVAFWLHLAAAPLIAHPVFHMLGVLDGNISAGMAVVVIALYVAFAFVALAVDRRALLVSSLVYVLWAMYSLFEQSGAVELAAALTALVIGSALLSLSAFWQPMRRAVVGLLGGLQERLPPAFA